MLTDLPASLPALPGYGENSLADLGASLLAALGLVREANPLRLPAADRVCVLVVDGLGWELLRGHQAAAPFLSELAVSGRPLTAGFPAMTATSLTSLGTGTPPGQHGVLGYLVAVPGEGRLLNTLRWDSRVDPVSWQPGPTIFERAAAAGIAGFHVAHPAVLRTGLSAAALRGAEGVAAWHARLARGAGRRRAAALGPGAGLRVPRAARLDGARVRVLIGRLALSPGPGRQAGRAPGGRAAAGNGAVRDGAITAWWTCRPRTGPTRTRCPGCATAWPCSAVTRGPGTCYAEPGAAADVLAAWREVLGHRAWVVSRDEAIAEGWFGPVDPRVVPRIGDVVAASTATSAIVATRAEPLESALIGMHGSLTLAEQAVPLLTLLPGPR